MLSMSESGKLFRQEKSSEKKKKEKSSGVRGQGFKTLNLSGSQFLL